MADIDVSELPRLETARHDPRFPNMNQAKACYQNYVDYFKCVAVKGEDFVPCEQFKRTYRSMCPTKWVETWDEQREENVFPPLHEKYAARVK